MKDFPTKSQGHPKQAGLLPLNKCSGKPVKSLVQTVAGGCTAGLNVPLTVGWAKSVQAQLVRHLCSTHSVWKILFVGKDQKDSIAELIFVQHSVQLISGGIDTIGVIGIYHKDQTLSVLVIVAPQWTDLILTSYIPHCE